MVNVGPRAGGAITAALFLGHFVDKVPHAHVDVCVEINQCARRRVDGVEVDAAIQHEGAVKF